MKTTFDQKVASSYDKWYETDSGRYISSLEEELIKELIGEVRDQRVVDLGCGTGNHLELLHTLGADSFGIDSSPFMLKRAEEKGKFKLILGKAEELPVKDSAFEAATLITTLEFCQDPAKVLQEAGRVAKDKIFLGVLNSWSALALKRRIKGWFGPSIYNRAVFFSIPKLKNMLEISFPHGSLEWKGVHSLPYSKLRFVRWLDRKLSFRRNPFCAFLGIVIVVERSS